MAGEDRAAADRLIDDLRERPFAHDFFAAVRRLENARPESPRIGHGQRLADDPIRFCQDPSMVFAPATIADLKLPVPDRNGPSVPRLLVHFFGLFGPSGPLPLHLTEYARDRERNSADPTFARFADVFHHRMLSLFYRAWASAQMPVSLERGRSDPMHDRFSLFIASLFGMAMPSFRDGDSVQDSAKLHFSGRLASPTRCAEGLQSIIRSYFQVPASVEQFQGQWMPLPPECRLRLGESPSTGQLGRSAIVGKRMWECQQKFRIRLGPLTLRDYRRFLPGSGCRSLERLVDWVRLYTSDELCWDLQLVLRRDEVPPIQLGRKEAGGGQLGWTTWSASQGMTRDPDDLIMQMADTQYA